MAEYDIKRTQWFDKQFKMLSGPVKDMKKDHCMFKCLARDNPNYDGGVKQYCVVYGPVGTQHLPECQLSIEKYIERLGDQHLYEMIVAYTPTRCYLDVDFRADMFDHEDVLWAVLDSMKQFGFDSKKGIVNTKVDNPIITQCVRPNDPTKASYHVIYPDYIFSTGHGDGLAKYMHAYKQWCSEHPEYGNLLWRDKKFVVDTSVYSRNRVMRLPGNSKKKDKEGSVFKYIIGERRSADWLIQPPTLSVDQVDSVYTDRIIMGWYPTGVDRFTKLYSNVDSYHLRKDEGGEVHITPAIAPLTVTGDVVIHRNEDMLQYLNVRELKALGFEDYFLPVVTSLAGSVDRTKLAMWCSSSGNNAVEKYGPLIDSSKENRRKMWVTGDMALQMIKKSLPKAKVVDRRKHVRGYENELAKTIEPTNDSDWKPVETSQMLEELRKTSISDNKVISGMPRRCVYITGKMGASKTTSVLKYLEQQLRRGNINSVLYVCPRTVLCAQTATAFEKIHREQLYTKVGRIHMEQIINVGRYYSGKKETQRFEPELNDVFKLLPEKITSSGVFDCCVVNSIEKVSKDKYDVVVSDEPVVTTGNFFMNYFAGGEVEQLSGYAIVYSKLYLHHIKSAQRVFFVDAAITPNVLDLCTHMFRGTVKPALKKDLISAKLTLPGTKKHITNALKNFFIEEGRDTPVNYAPDLKFVVHDEKIVKPIFDTIVEYMEWNNLITDLNNKVQTGSKAIVYCSTARTARILYGYVSNSVENPKKVPRACLVTSETLQDDGRDGTLRTMIGSQIAFVTSGLGIGSSFPLPDMFDEAFAFLEYNDRTPQMDDMIQLCARVRCTTDRKLSYAVRCGTSHPSDIYVGSNKNRIPNVDFIGKLHKAFFDRADIHKAHCMFPSLAKEDTREAFLKAFSYDPMGDMVYSRPVLKTAEKRVEDDPVPKGMRRSLFSRRNVDEKLDKDLVYSSKSIPKALVRCDKVKDEFETNDDDTRFVGVMGTEKCVRPILRKGKRKADNDDDEDDDDDDEHITAKKVCLMDTKQESDSPEACENHWEFF